MSGIVGSKLNIRGSGRVAKLGTDGQVLTSAGAGVSAVYEDGATTYDDDKLQSNIALLGFKTAVNGSLAKYNLQDQIIDEYENNSGIDTGASTNEALTSGVYYGQVTVTPTVTEDADDTGTDGDYTWYKWTDTAATGSYNTDTTQDHEYLMVGGGASGGAQTAKSGGGGGGVLAATGLSLTGGNEYTVTIGAGGAGRTSPAAGDDGDDSILSGTGISTLTAGGGGGGGLRLSPNAGADGRATNGSGGGGGSAGGIGGSGHGTGGDGGTTAATSNAASGGGGAGGDGGNGIYYYPYADGAAGGVGVANDIIETGTDVYYGGGGGGGCETAGTGGAGGNGGGSNGANGTNNSSNGTANTGGGSGGANDGNSGNGGSGIVILRRLTATTAVGDLTLQSTANTASSAATKADLIMLMENAAGTATINVDIKGYVTADGGSNWTEGTLVDEGSWGTNKKIYAFHDATVTSGTDMRYKITTHNQVASSKETKIHATSIGWKA